MRRFALAAALAAGLIAPADHGFAQGDRPAKPRPGQAEPKRAATLDELFSRLAAAKEETEANGVASLIERRWMRSGSDTADLLMSRAGEAIKAKDYPLAIELLDRVIALQPGWAEAWNRRATAFYLLDDPVSAIADLRQVLAREPRHFAALAGLGHIYMASGDKARALDTFRRALAIHPYLDPVRTTVERLTPEIDGRDL
jgi:tetratricopeptide (TPR) repeat protein